MMAEMGLTYEYPDNRIHRKDNAKKLEDYIVNSKEWYSVFDFIEK